MTIKSFNTVFASAIAALFSAAVFVGASVGPAAQNAAALMV